MFTLKIAYEGTWVVVSDPEAVKQVFTGDPRVFHAGEGNQILRPLLGDNSLLVLDEKPPHEPAPAAAAALPRRAHAGLRQKMTEIAAREIDSWPLGTPYKLRPRMQAITLEIILETVFGVHGGSGWSRSGGAARLPRPDHQSAAAAPVILVGPDRIRRVPPSAAASTGSTR